MNSAPGRLRDGTASTRVSLSSGWEVLATAAGLVAEPSALPAEGWLASSVPATAASALAAHGLWNLEGAPRQFDSEDWWWRLRFSSSSAAGERAVLCFDGLATVADVWLNGAHVLHSENMFLGHELELGAAGSYELVLCCRSLEAALRARRPRPRWRVPMLEQQQLRWFRTTLLGRTPGWSPPAAAVGPWREIRVERRRDLVVSATRLKSRVEPGVGVVDFSCMVECLAEAGGVRAELVLSRDGTEQRAVLSHVEGRVSGSLRVASPARWWPHTHGEPALYEARLELSSARWAYQLPLGALGFRTLSLDTADGDFALSVNGEFVFCRGACWTPLDVVTLTGSRSALKATLARVVAAGMNMLRVGGTMVYETNDFYELCDELGILVWQDFMFANMDYPDDEAFRAIVQAEVRQVLARLEPRPCLAVLCGSSEGEQQAAMWGAARELWSPPLFHRLLKELAGELCAGVPYWPSSAHGGAFPHQANAGSTSYYGVGAYLRPLEDARLSGVRFASECLAFANIPAPDALPGGPAVRVHHPAWKARTPRDLGAGWDFDDVRDHYLGRLFGVEPPTLRSTDHERYLALGALVTGEVMARTFSEWRRQGSACRGALIWFLKDLWPSAGWGVLDSTGRPKPAYWYLRRALQPLGLSLVDEGVNGLFAQIVNERAEAREVELEVALYRDAEIPLGRFRKGLRLEARARREVPIAELLDGFSDLTYAYRFGPPGCDLVVAWLLEGEARVSEAYYFVLGLPSRVEREVGLSAELHSVGEGRAELVVRSRRLAYAVRVEVSGATSDDDYFNVAPGAERRLSLSHEGPFESLRGALRAHNSAAAAQFSGKG
jgi:beta-mannosidase